MTKLMDTEQLESVVGKVPINPKGGSRVHLRNPTYNTQQQRG